MVRGQAVATTSPDWTVIRDNIEVIGVDGRDLICRSFTEETQVRSAGGRGNMALSPVYSQVKTYKDTFVLTNYPSAGQFSRGDSIHPPLMVMRVGAAMLHSGDVTVYRSSYGTDTAYHNASQYVLYDYGTPYAPPQRPLTAEEIAAAKDAVAKKKAAGEAAKLKFDQELAEAGKDLYQYRMGVRCLEANGVERDTNQAKVWFGKAAAQGSEDAAKALKKLGGS